MTGTRLERWSGAWLGTALVLTTATQLRFGGLPVGPGEVLLGAWLLGAVATLGTRGLSRPGIGGTLLLAFWGVGAAALALGWIVGLADGDSTLLNGRDLVAFGLVVAMIVLLAFDGRARFVAQAAARAIPVVGVATMLVLGAAMIATRGGSVGPIQPLYGDARFRGWAENPNQLALLLVTVPLAAVAFARQGRKNRPIWLAIGVAGILLGVITGSDALKAAWAVVLALAVFAGWLRVTFGRFARTAPAALFAIGAPVAIGIGVLATGDRLVRAVEDQVAETFEVGGQGQDRVGRWLYGFEALEDSPLVGLGPGPFSGGSGPFQGQEAHNSVVDWIVSTGLLGLVALLVLGVGAAVAVARRRRPLSGAIGIALVIFASLHYVFRQPLAWFLVLAVVDGIFDEPSTPEARGVS
jgi:O-antigen ligase